MKALWLRLGTLGAVLAILAPTPAAAATREAWTPEMGLQVPNFNVPAAQLRVAIDTTLAEHAFLIGEAIRSGIEQGADFEAAGSALEDNTVDLIGLIASVYGEPAGDAFGDLWRSHIAFLIDYTRALADADTNARLLAEEQLDVYVADFSAFLAGANPNWPEEVVAELIDEHVAQLKSVAEFAAGDYGDAYPTLHATFSHMFDIGDALAEGIALQFPDIFTGKSLAFSPAGDLRLVLDRLLGEHTTLAVSAMRAGLTGADDALAAQDALDGNTAAIGRWVGNVYGNAAGEAFLDLWTEHTDAYLAYVNSTVAGSTIGQDAALDRLATYQNDFSQFLADANPNLSAADLNTMLAHHTDQLVAEADAYDAGDYDEAYALAREAFSHAVTMGDALALAIAAQFPDRFPDAALDMPKAPPIALLGWLLLALAVLTAGKAVRAMPG